MSGTTAQFSSGSGAANPAVAGAAQSAAPALCEALVTSRNVRRCQRPAKFRVWETTFPDRSMPVNESRTVKLVCGMHRNSFVITLGFQYDEVVEHPTPSARSAPATVDGDQS